MTAGTLILSLLLIVAPLAAQPADVPELRFEAPAATAAYAERLDRVDRRRIAAVMRLVGLAEPGGPIRVLVLPEDSPLAERTPSWVSGYTREPGGAIVLFPERVPAYPHDSLESLLQHEIAHVLIARAAGGRHVPRWFHEGVAMAAERAWGFGDRARFLYEVARRGAVPVGGLDGLFRGNERSVVLAYSLAGAFMDEMLAAQGSDWPARVLAAVRAGRSFDDAFARTTGTSVAAASDAFWGRHRLVAVWLPWATSTTTMWSAITLLALAAFIEVRRRRAAKRRQWEAEEGPDAPTDPPYTVH